MDSENLIHNLSVVREYFSHNMRTSTAMVVATVSIFKFGLSDDTDNMTDMIIESSYFLDVYDKGMEVLFNFVLGKPIKNEQEKFDPVKITGKVIEDLRCSINEQNIKVSCIFDEMSDVKTNSYIANTLLELILCEEVRKCSSELNIVSRDNVLTLKKANQTDIPEIYNIFNKILAEVNIEFTYTSDSVSLRFLS